jgi:Protein of unknown function (DUF3106)
MRKTITVALALVFWAGVASSAIGQESKPQVSQEGKDKWQSLTPEQKQGVKDRGKQRTEAREKITPEQKEALKQKWESLTPEQKQELKSKRVDARQKLTTEQKEALKQKWDGLTPEQKDEIKAKRQTK